MNRRLLVVPLTVLTIALGATNAAQADQADLGAENNDLLQGIAPGTVVDFSSALVVARSGLTNVVYESAKTFAVGETVTAALSPVVWPGAFGTLELTGVTSVVGTTADSWSSGGTLTFAPAVDFHYTAPSATELGCDDNPGATFGGVVGVHAEFLGDAGTRAHTDPKASGAWIPGVSVTVDCPAVVPSRSPKPLLGGPARILVASGILRHDETGGAWPLPGIEIDITVVDGSPSHGVVTTDANGEASFDLTVAPGHASARVSISEGPTEYPFVYTQVSHSYMGPVIDSTDRSTVVFDVYPDGIDYQCGFYHEVSPTPTSRPTSAPPHAPTMPPTDTDVAPGADDRQPDTVALLLLLIGPMVLLLRRSRREGV